MLVQRGTLKKQAYLVANSAYCKVRAMYDDRGKTVTTAGPGSAVEVLGWKELPSVGDFIQEVPSEVCSDWEIKLCMCHNKLPCSYYYIRWDI